MAAAASATSLQKSLLKSHDRSVDSAAELPSGRCNFTNLDIGGGRCGCLRFWDKSKFDQSNVRESIGWCMCQHHACYHETEGASSNASHQVVSIDAHRKAQASTSAPELQIIEAVSASQHEQAAQGKSATYQTITTQPFTHHSFGSHPGAAQWRNAVQPSPTYGGNPPLPTECLLPPDISSGGISGDSQAFLAMLNDDLRTQKTNPNTQDNGGDSILRHGSNIGMPVEDDNREPSGPATARPGSPVLTPTDTLNYHIQQLQTEVNVMSGCESGNEIPTEIQAATSKAIVPHPSRTTAEPILHNITVPVRKIMPHLENILKHVTSFPTLATTSENHSRRIDLLENASYSNIAIDELRDTTENLNEQIRDVEEKFDDLKKAVSALNDGASVTSFRRDGRFLDDRSMNSDTSSAMIASAIDHADFSSRLEAIETQLSAYQSSVLPSFSHPWELEVIYLPFGTKLRGLWHLLEEFPSQRSRNNSMAADDWTQTHHAILAKSQAKLDVNESAQQSWEDIAGAEDSSFKWLVARACGPGSKVEERLRSRGLIRNIQVQGPDARDVQAAMATAFGETITIMSDASSQGANITTHTNGYHGLHAPWIPLRKVHKDSRLRLLDPSEMVTPALWTVIFLSSSVAMRASGTRRLYVTHRDAYMQSVPTCHNWTWQKLRELPRVHDDLQASLGVGEADAMEQCWQFDGRLDSTPPSIHSSFESHYSSLSIRPVAHAGAHSSSSSSNGSHSTHKQSTTPTSPHRGYFPGPLKERPVHGRAISMPLAIKSSPTGSAFPTTKRRIASFDLDYELPQSNTHQHPQSSPIRLHHLQSSHRQSSPAGLIKSSQTRLSPSLVKRRRMSRSPSRPHDMITPRWSAGPPSPYVYEDATAGMERQHATAPFAYATPHSNFTPYSDNKDLDDDDKGSTTDDMGIDDDIGIDGFDDDDDSDDEMEGNDYPSGSHNTRDDVYGGYDAQPLGQRVEDEVWEGVEDRLNDTFDNVEQNALSDDGDEDEGNISDASSAPSEYPSTQLGLFYEASGRKPAFQIHVDDDEGEKDI